jgi:hypothetical protein
MTLALPPAELRTYLFKMKKILISIDDRLKDLFRGDEYDVDSTQISWVRRTSRARSSFPDARRRLPGRVRSTLVELWRSCILKPSSVPKGRRT